MLCSGSCKDNRLFDNIPGTYKMEVEVINRKYVYLKSSLKVEGYMEYFHNQLISTLSDSMCCHQPSFVPLCPWSYNYDNFQIFKEHGKYYLRNFVDDTNASGETELSHLKFEDDGKNIRFEGNHLQSRSDYIYPLLRDGDPNNDPLEYPIVFRILYISLDKVGRNTMEGEWFIADARNCDGYHLGQEFFNGEYAKIKLTKVK